MNKNMARGGEQNEEAEKAQRGTLEKSKAPETYSIIILYVFGMFLLR